MNIIFITCYSQISASIIDKDDDSSVEEWFRQRKIENGFLKYDSDGDLVDTWDYWDIEDNWDSKDAWDSEDEENHIPDPVKTKVANENDLNLINIDINAHENVANDDVNKEKNEAGIFEDSDSEIHGANNTITNDTEDTGHDIGENTKKSAVSNNIVSKKADTKNIKGKSNSGKCRKKRINDDISLKTASNSKITNQTNTYDNKNKKCIFNAEEILTFIKKERREIIDSNECVPSKEEIRLHDRFIKQQINKYGKIILNYEAREKLMADYIMERRKRMNFYNENEILQREIRDFIEKKEKKNCSDRTTRDIKTAKIIVNYLQNRSSVIIFRQNFKPSCQEYINYIANFKNKLNLLGCIMPESWPSNNERDEMLKLIKCEIQNFNLIKIGEFEIEDFVKEREESFRGLKEEEHGAVLDEDILCAKEDVKMDEKQDL